LGFDWLLIGCRWFGLRLDWAGSVLVSSTLLAIILTRIYDRSSLDIGSAALAISTFPFLSLPSFLSNHPKSAYTSGMTFIFSTLNVMSVETETRV